MSDYDCDYCGTYCGERFYLRAVGFTEHEGKRAPLVKAWCGHCLVDDEVVHKADVALRAAVAAQTGKRL